MRWTRDQPTAPTRRETTMNRVLCYLDQCDCQRHERLRDRDRRAAEELQVIVGDAVEVEANAFQANKNDQRLTFCVLTEIQPTKDLGNSHAHLHAELLRVIVELTAAADRLEAGLGEAEGVEGPGGAEGPERTGGTKGGAA